jgi:hypothetical protein
MGKRPRGPLLKWEPRTPRQIGVLADLVARYAQHVAEDTLPRGGRGMFYDLRPAGMGNGITYKKPTDDHPAKDFGPMEAHPDSVQEVLLLARRAGIIPETWVADTRAPDPIGPASWEDAEDFARYAVAVFALGLQRGQDCYVEIVCEAEDLQPRVSRQAGPKGVFVFSGAGFDGLKGKRFFADRAARRGVPTVVLQITDFDIHGGHIASAAEEDAQAWATEHYGLPAGWLSFERIALTRTQAEENDLLDDDGKAEVDGLPVPVIDAIVNNAIDGLLDPAGRENVRADRRRQLHHLPQAIADEVAATEEESDDEDESE